MGCQTSKAVVAPRSDCMPEACIEEWNVSSQVVLRPPTEALPTSVPSPHLHSNKTQHGRELEDVQQNSDTLKDLEWHSVIGAGAFGVVWLVSYTSNGHVCQQFALKVLPKHNNLQKKQVKSVWRERRIMAQLCHPFLMSLKQSFQDDNFLYMLVDYCRRGDLYSFLHGKNAHALTKSEESALFFSSCLIEALSYLHKNGIVHRDIKPENILIDELGYPKLSDFGMSKVLGTAEKTFTKCGTPLYKAPEVILNNGHGYGVDHWAIGMLIYEITTGRTPFFTTGMDLDEIYHYTITGRPVGTALVEYSFSWKSGDLIARLLTPDPANRLGSSSKWGIDDIRMHPYFFGINFSALLNRQVKSPLNPLDTSPCFVQSEVHKTKLTEFHPLSARVRQRFDGF